ncbi:hypothetical protein EYF80_038227 [Liparis tanakae]|uniref:Uncharacterized protein n=1 Tax=Liparis tanakae TaxID=230148 RepID=A0A4Z2GDG5_9TELE|nr:hypothetical protein EYF80_038227 [Liparis tanakae]
MCDCAGGGEKKDRAGSSTRDGLYEEVIRGSGDAPRRYGAPEEPRVTDFLSFGAPMRWIQSGAASCDITGGDPSDVSRLPLCSRSGARLPSTADAAVVLHKRRCKPTRSHGTAYK